MHSPSSTYLVAQQRIADLHREADHDRLVHAATTASGSDDPPPVAHAVAVAVTLIRRLRRRLAHTHPAAR
jgi:hypothetical protein